MYTRIDWIRVGTFWAWACDPCLVCGCFAQSSFYGAVDYIGVLGATRWAHSVYVCRAFGVQLIYGVKIYYHTLKKKR
jgi:hypothetical protein